MEVECSSIVHLRDQQKLVSIRNPASLAHADASSIDEAPGWIVSLAQVLSYTLAIPCRKFRAWRAITLAE
jgi:hypothetical protein